MTIKKYHIKLMYMLYFLLSGTAIKTAGYFFVLDGLFLILIPLTLFFSYLINPTYSQNKETKLIIIIALFYIFQVTVISRSLKYTLNEIIYIVPNFILYFYVYKEEEIKREDYKKFIYLIAIFLATTLIGSEDYIYYKKGIFNNSIGTGMFSILGFYLADLAIDRKMPKLLFQLFFLTTLLISNTRGCMLALLVYFIFSRGISIKKILRSLIGLGILMSIGVLTKVINLEKILNKYGSETLDLMTGRPDIWLKSWDYFKEQNIFGLGIGHYNLIQRIGSFGYPENVHNSYLDIIFSMGIYLGIITLGLIAAKVIILIKNSMEIEEIKEKVLYNKRLGIIISILTLSLGESTLFFTRMPLTFIFWNILGELSKKERIKLNYK